MKQLLKVLKKGVFCSLQDNGRFRFRKFGIPTAGPMDKLSFELGKKILGNDNNITALEIFYGGMTFEALSRHEYVLVGADMNAKVNKKEIETWKTFILNEGDSLKIDFSKQGSIAYLIPIGGFKEEAILNSCSTYLKANLGCTIQNGTILYGEDYPLLKNRRGLFYKFIPEFPSHNQIRVVPSYQLDYFEEEDVDRFFTEEYQFTSGDRMGYFYRGPKLNMKCKKDILSEPTMFGTIQIPPEGQPIILMADGQTVGGYPIVGKILDEDLWKVAQQRYGDRISFIRENING